MPFVNNKKLVEIRESAKGGNEKALMILQAMRKMSPQEDLDRLVDDYYKVDTVEPVIPQETVEQESFNIPEELTPELMNETAEPGNVVDLTSTLDTEMDGLLDENELDDLSFGDFLSNKKRDGLRGRKNADYFKAYDPEGRANYMHNKIDAYKGKFDGRLRDIERRYNDMSKSIAGYTQGINDMLDDSAELDMLSVNNAYDELTGNENAMRSFGRHWDENDNMSVMMELKALIEKYGKKNVMAVLNTLQSDNENYKKYLNNQVDTEIGRYSKSVENLLK